MATFKEFLLPEAIEQAVTDLGFTEPTPIQAQSIPVAMKGGDLIACAETGSGKTAAYCLPMLAKLMENENSSALILAPTRELAKQISEVVRSLTSRSRQLSMAVLVGGADMRKQLRTLKKAPRIVVATPGRLTDHLRRRSLTLTQTQFLVLDEGDRMLDMGFAPQLDQILKYLPKARQTLLFSATISTKVRKLAENYLKQPTKITVGEARPVKSIKQTALETTKDNKDELLLDELNKRQGSIIVFTKTKMRTEFLAKYLNGYGLSVSRIHGGRSQGQRNIALQGFRDGKFRILVATDVASRGIDVPQIAHVINYDLPMADEDYVHRIGRTARAGASGEALSLLLPQDRQQWFKLAKKYDIQGVALTSNYVGDSERGRKGKKRGFKKPFSKSGPRRPGRGSRPSRFSNRANA